MHRIEQLQKLLEQTPEDCFILHALGLELAKQARWEEARTYFERVLDVDELYVGTYYHLGQLLAQCQKTKEAFEVYQRGMEVAKHLKDQHSYNELLMAQDDLS